MEDLLRIMAQLRAPQGCPWDREQTHDSILTCLVEESFEFIDAVERRDIPNMAEELGDILLQVVFHSQMAKEAGTFGIEEVVHGIAEKLVRRHPHVFGNAQAQDSNAVMVQWEALKDQEKAQKSKNPSLSGDLPVDSLLGQIPRSLPALPKSQKIQKRAAKVGFDWPDHQGPLAKVYEELREFEVELAAYQNAEAAKRAAKTEPTEASLQSQASRAMAGEHPTPDQERIRLEAEFGDMLFALVNLGRHLEIDAERALSQTNLRFMQRFEAMEKLAKAARQDFEKLDLEAKEALWQEAKRITRTPNY
jgi:MazG family protein